MVPHPMRADFITAFPEDAYAGEASDDVIPAQLHFGCAVYLPD